ncbi:MAG: acyl--CoA ligase [Candidatus Omnitrophica bacterium]|nr:acyl--CoA ligase [Candidatus Omnitrophota bacterium]
MNISNVLCIASQKYGPKPAVIFKEEQITYSRLAEEVAKLAAGLKNLGVAKAVKVGIYLPNSPEYVYSYLACFTLGAVVVPLDYQLKEDELASCLGHSETKFLIARPHGDIALDKVVSDAGTVEKIVLVGADATQSHQIAWTSLMQTQATSLPAVSIDPKDPSMILYTSGTTGKPKGILLNYRHLEGSPKAMEHFVDLSDKDIKLCAIPLSHIGGFIYIQNCILFGITLVLMDRFNPVEFLRNIQEFKVTCFHIVPAMYTALLSLKNLDKFDLSSLRWVVVFGAPSSPEILERFHQYCPNAQLLNGWGMTETCPPNTVTPLGSKKIASIGKPSPLCEIKIFDEQNKEIAGGEVGEIVIRGWTIMDGYYRDPETTQSLMSDGGWFHTGDLGKFDEEGYLYIVGRKKEMIKVAGQIVFAPEVEAAFYKNPDVVDAAVIGIPDPLRGEAIKAFIALKPESKLTAEELRYFAKEHLANFKVPQHIEIMETLPKNRTGKIDKELLKQAGIAR